MADDRVTAPVAYVPKNDLYDHQARIFEETREMEYYALFWEVGVGKTWPMIDTAAYLYERKKIDAFLIIAPGGVHLNWTRREIVKHMPDRVPRFSLAWDASKRTKEYNKALVRLFDAASELKIFAVNVEALSGKRGREVAEKFLRRFPRSLTVIDESTRVKNPKAKRTKAALKLRELTPYRRILTGTPVTTSPLDLYTQMWFLAPRILGYTSWYAFRNRYAKVVTKRTVDSGGRVYTYEDIVGYRNLDELRRKTERYSSRLTKEECLDLPPTIFIRLPVQMSKEQARLYHKLADEYVLEAEGTEIPVAMALTRLMRLQQLTGGHVVTEEGTTVPIEGTNPKMAAILEELEDLPEDKSVVLWSHFVPELKLMATALRERFGYDAVGLYCGEVSKAERADLVDRFQEKKTRFFVGNPQVAGLGLTLTAATVVYYFSNEFSPEDRWQSIGRCHRATQKNVVVYKDVVCIDTVDERVLDVLDERKSVADVVTGDGIRGLV